jgi:hypothetical protein
MALKAKVVELGGRGRVIIGGEEHKPIRIIPTISGIKSVMAVGTASYWITCV